MRRQLQLRALLFGHGGEDACEAGNRRVEEASQLRQQDFLARDRCQGRYTRLVEQLAIKRARLDHDLVVGLGEVADNSRCGDGVDGKP